MPDSPDVDAFHDALAKLLDLGDEPVDAEPKDPGAVVAANSRSGFRATPGWAKTDE